VTGPDQPAPTPSEPRAALSRELSDLLIEFSIALNKYAMYPEGHPSLAPAVARVTDRLVPLVEQRGTLSLGVARHQLVIEGVATDPKNPVLSDLASRLHRHHLGAIAFRRGVTTDELTSSLALLAIEADRMDEPLGLGPRERLGQWSHVQLYPVTYERLELVRDRAGSAEESSDKAEARTRAAQLWLGLARAALAADQADDAAQADDAVAADPTAVARAIHDHPRGSAYDQVIVGYLLQIADELRTGTAGEAGELKRRMAQLITTLDDTTLQGLLEMGGDALQRRRFLLSAAEGMAADAVLDLVKAASQAEQQNVTHALLRVLEKLAHHAEHGVGRRRRDADASLREQIAELIRGWSLTDPNPGTYGEALRRMSRTASIFAVAPEQRFRPEPRRLVEIALEVDEPGELVRRAADEIIEHEGVAWITNRLSTGEAPAVERDLWGHLTAPDTVAKLARAVPLDVDRLDEVLARAGPEVAEPLLDVLAESDSSATRRILLDRLARLGPEVGERALRRLDDTRWFVVRNLLKLLADLPTAPSQFDPDRFAKHEDPRVRFEALRLLYQSEDRRERAVCASLGDPDPRVVELGLREARRQMPPAAVPLLARLARSEGAPDLQEMAVRALGAVPQPVALDLLLGITAVRKGLLRARLPPKSRVYLAALRALGEGFAHDPRARDALAAARRSRDPEIAEAARAGGVS
jgi:hypothetical protein